MNARDSIHVVFGGGGTGGHLFPGLAVAGRLCEEMGGVRITFAGSGREFERQHVAAAGFEYLSLRCRPLPRRPWHLPGFLADNLAGYLAARRFLREQDVRAVVGLGGFASVPMARAAAGLRLPLVLLEQNAVPGRATRWLARRADCVCLALPEASRYFRRGCNLQVTGNPIRTGLILSFPGSAWERTARFSFPGSAWERTARKALPRLKSIPWHSFPHATEKRQSQAGGACQAVRSQAEPGNECLALDEPLSHRQLLILGGSSGARALNENVPRALGRLGRKLGGWSVVHQAGEAEWQSTRRLYQSLGVPATVVPFIADVGGMLAASDLAVCRAGGTTLAELAASGVPALLLPYPHAADDHQRKNAEAYAAGGGCLVLDEQGPTGALDARLAGTLAMLLADARLRKAMSRSMRRLARPRAAGDVAAIIRRLVA